ncbi:MAG: hypothetical protein CME25_08050 [Gemmatimonadetes bacterium]|nr:hypothetical protein [Gemmatimonadota bacterium]
MYVADTGNQRVRKVAAPIRESTSPGWHEELPNMSYPPTPFKRFDLDGDGRIDFYDFLIFDQDQVDALEAQNAQ